MYKPIKINRVSSNFLLKIFELTDEQLAAIDYQIPMTQEIYNSILDRCTELGAMSDDLFFSLLNEYPEYLSVYDQKIKDEMSKKYRAIDIPESSLRELRIGKEVLCRRIKEKYKEESRTFFGES